MAEERTRIHTRIIPETEHKIAAAMPPSNCQTQNEFVKKALRFYCDYTSPQSCFSVLPPMLVAAIRSTVQGSENHICRLLFKLAVEMDMMMNVLSAGMEFPVEQLERLRPQCVRNVKRTSGSISLDRVAERQRPLE